MANILVTGGAGYIGSHTCKALKAAGHNPVALDNLCRGFQSAVLWGPFINADIRNFEAVTKALHDHSIDAVLHFAALAYIKESVEKPNLYWDNNVEGSLLLLEAMKSAGVTNLVFSSTCATYGESKSPLIDESHPQSPINPYGLTKLTIEKMLLSYEKLYDFNFCALRYFNAAGADPEGEIGENHDPEPHIIPTFIKKALKNETLQINGNDFDTKDGTCVRDFIHVSDLAQAHVITLNSLLENKNEHPFYNIGTGTGYSLLEIAENIKAEIGSSSDIEFGERRNGDPARLIGNPSLFQNEFSWSPQISNLSSLIKTAAQWLKK